jgi:type III pantothenate kinase
VIREVVVDIGNTRVKFGLCDEMDMAGETASLPADDPAAWAEQLAAWRVTRVARWAVASVHPARLAAFRAWAEGRGELVVAVDHYLQLPLKVDVDEPEKVGIDRLLNALAFRQVLPKGSPGVVIDVGTATTVDLLDELHVFRGGAILPGPRLMFESLHRQTAKLPLIDLHAVPGADPPGRNTRDAMTVGVMAALMGAAEFLVREYAGQFQNPPWVMMTGGALGTLADHHFAEAANTLTDPALTLEGIRLAAGALP